MGPRERVVRKPGKCGTLVHTEIWLSPTHRSEHTFQRKMGALEPHQRSKTRRVKDPKVMSHEKLGMSSLEKIEKK